MTRQYYEMAGIRLDSEDLARLSVKARKILDAEGFPNAFIIGSNELDEKTITGLKQRGARISVWGYPRVSLADIK
jgi:nicotinate phosphoribosyltransferase